jgi:hypothetical protein
MYLARRIFVGAEFEHREITGSIEIRKGEKPVPVYLKRVSHINETVAYWRKANHIHQWFVENCQGGVDECQESYLKLEKLEELLEVCKKVEKTPNLAPDLLPTQSGFFFGSTDYDEGYFEDIRYTIVTIEGLISEFKAMDPDIQCDISFCYQSSW